MVHQLTKAWRQRTFASKGYELAHPAIPRAASGTHSTNDTHFATLALPSSATDTTTVGRLAPFPIAKRPFHIFCAL